MPWYLFDPDSKFSVLQNSQVQLVTWYSLVLTPFTLVFYEEMAGGGSLTDALLIAEWIVDVSWAFEMCLNFLTADAANRTFKAIAINYLSFWFWIDAAATLPAMACLQAQQWALACKLLRLLHFSHLFRPIELTIHWLMRHRLRCEAENAYGLCVLVTGTLLLAHLFACCWIYLGRLSEDSWINA